MSEMSERDQGQTPTVPTTGNDVTAEGEGFLHLEVSDDLPANEQSIQAAITPDITAAPSSSQAYERAGTVEHLAAQRSFPPLNTSDPEIKQHLAVLRTEVTRLLTSLRWEGATIDETAHRLNALLNIGPVGQWQSILIPFLYEIDRAGALLPIWLTILDQDDMANLTPETNPAETPEGRARRYAILMLGNYRTMGITGANHSDSDVATNLPRLLGQLATDPNVSLYATEALVKQATVPAMQSLIEALKDARGWAKVDVVEGCLALKQERFYDMVISRGLDDAPGLESFIANPIYRTIPIEQYFSTQHEVSPHLQANAALIVQRVLRESMNPPSNENPKPPVFERYFPTVAQELFAAARRNPTWQYAVALHYLGLLMGRYWNEISRNTMKDGSIIEQIYAVSTQMNDVERWMSGPGRDALLCAIADPQEENVTLIARILGEIREPRATTPLIERLERVKTSGDRTHALTLGALCEALGRIGEPRAALPMLQLIKRTIDISRRSQQPRRHDNLPFGDPDVPGSIIYAAAIRAAGLLGERSTIENVWIAASDLDPYVRTQALEALQRLDPQGEYQRSREVARESINDPRESVVQQATHVIAQYHDIDAVPLLRRALDSRPELTYLFQETLQKLGQ